MPRYRKLHVKTVESMDINDMPDDFTRLFWVLLPLALCREGRGIYNARWLQSKLFPLREDVTMEMIDAAINWFVSRDMVRPYCVDDREYFYVPTFHRYQGNTVKEAPSEYPAPPAEVSPELVESSAGEGPELEKPKQPQITTASASASAFASESASNTELVQTESVIETFIKVRGGAINPIDVDQIMDLVSEFEEHRAQLSRASPGADIPGDGWVRAAILEGNASRKDGRMVHLNYIKAILDRWRTEGYQAKFRPDSNVTQENGRTVITVDS